MAETVARLGEFNVVDFVVQQGRPLAVVQLPPDGPSNLNERVGTAQGAVFQRDDRHAGLTRPAADLERMAVVVVAQRDQHADVDVGSREIGPMLFDDPRHHLQCFGVGFPVGHSHCQAPQNGGLVVRASCCRLSSTARKSLGSRAAHLASMS